MTFVRRGSYWRNRVGWKKKAAPGSVAEEGLAVLFGAHPAQQQERAFGVETRRGRGDADMETLARNTQQACEGGFGSAAAEERAGLAGELCPERGFGAGTEYLSR